MGVYDFSIVKDRTHWAMNHCFKKLTPHSVTELKELYTDFICFNVLFRFLISMFCFSESLFGPCSLFCMIFSTRLFK